ncbi:MAG: hypothetical protein C7B45_08800 [Sulfobacillus acidophilus]|uniref:t-SNARE coiled-coil homology domain-containing protein n=1 Tax=Sulfobacillus acidophilus TaxID=53633 RepID=A0A2T2WIB2_9FIRM|nr:MAG: hypothetical protein C7B45_08800 [Sulfobacillus acidophilus]
MADQPPILPSSQDFPDHWGFYLLQAINRLDDKIDEVRRDQERIVESLRQEIGGVRQDVGGIHHEIASVRQEVGGLHQDLASVRQEVSGAHQVIASVRQEVSSARQVIASVRQEVSSARQEIHALDTKFDQKLTALQYWYWGTLIVIIMGFVVLFFTRP